MRALSFPVSTWTLFNPPPLWLEGKWSAAGLMRDFLSSLTSTPLPHPSPLLHPPPHLSLLLLTHPSTPIEYSRFSLPYMYNSFCINLPPPPPLDVLYFQTLQILNFLRRYNLFAKSFSFISSVWYSLWRDIASKTIEFLHLFECVNMRWTGMLFTHL